MVGSNVGRPPDEWPAGDGSGLSIFSPADNLAPAQGSGYRRPRRRKCRPADSEVVTRVTGDVGDDA
jgi:hypothetical protein